MDIDTHSLLLHDIQVEIGNRYGDFGGFMDRLVVCGREIAVGGCCRVRVGRLYYK